MKPPWLRSGWPGWAAVLVGIAAFDALAPETMSHAWHRGRQHPVTFAAQATAWAYLTAHLFRLIPEKFDPLEIADDLWVARTGVRREVPAPLVAPRA